MSLSIVHPLFDLLSMFLMQVIFFFSVLRKVVSFFITSFAKNKMFVFTKFSLNDNL